MSIRSCLLLFALTFAAGAQSITAQQITMDLDPAKSKIEFVLGDVLHTVHGTFRLKTGHVAFDPISGAVSGEATVDANSGDSGGSLRDKRMKRDILETDRYPDISFAPTKVAGTVSAAGNSPVKVTGWFSLHGQRHEITIPMEVRMSGSDILATSSFSIPYVAWGLKNPSTFMLRVNDHVDIQLTAAGSLAAVRMSRR
jgi:polyisoprenoid-binding protein YceI